MSVRLVRRALSARSVAPGPRLLLVAVALGANARTGVWSGRWEDLAAVVVGEDVPPPAATWWQSSPTTLEVTDRRRSARRRFRWVVRQLVVAGLLVEVRDHGWEPRATYRVTLDRDDGTR